MNRTIWTAILQDLSIYLNTKYPNEKFACMMDNVSSHQMIAELPYQNIEFVRLPGRFAKKEFIASKTGRMVSPYAHFPLPKPRLITIASHSKAAYIAFLVLRKL